MIRANIDEKGARARKRMGWTVLVLGLVLAAWLIIRKAPVWALLGLYPVFLVAGLGVYQARRRT